MNISDYKICAHIKRHIELNVSNTEYLESIFYVKHIKKKELVLTQGHLCNKLFFVEDGSLRAFNTTDEGKESTMMFAVENWWITDMYCFSNQKRSMLSLEALEDSTVMVLSYAYFQELLLRVPQFERFFRILFQNAYSREQLRVLDAISLPTEARYQRFLDKYPQIAGKITQKQIAAYLGVTPEFLSSVKKK